MDKFKIDSHKLIYHVERVNDWLKGNAVYPIYLEIAPSGGCNHRCTFCALDFLEYRPIFLDTALLKEQLCEMAGLGIKSIMYAGEGEPLLHKDIADIINYTKRLGIDVALTTNGVLLKKELINKMLGSTSWIKVSINGATRDRYAKIHNANADDFDKVMENLSYAVGVKRAKKYECALGMQLLLLDENAGEVVLLAKKAKALGMDYLVVKPYSHHPFSKTSKYKNISYSKYLYLTDELNALNDEKFNIVFRVKTMKKWDEAERNYRHCYALPFWSYIDAGGNIWGCSAYLGDGSFIYGNIYKNSFKKIWNGPRRKKIANMAGNKLDANRCRVNCRMDEINRYLWELRHPPEHVNFI